MSTIKQNEGLIMRAFANAIAISAALSACLVAGDAMAQESAAEGPEISGNFSVWTGNDYVTPHGLVATTRGTTIQTDGSVTLKLDSGVTLTGGVWTDFNPGYDKLANTRTVNETDPYFAVTLPVTDKLALTAKYVAFIGNNLPETAHNVALVAGYSDGGPNSAFSVNPYAVFFYEVDGSSVIGVGKAGNTWDVWLGATPTLKLDGVTLAAPTWVTVGPKSFFGAIDDGNVGVVSTGLKVIKPISLGPKAGNWAIFANVQYYHLANDNLRLVKSVLNRGDSGSDTVQFGAGLSVGF
jgi:hypothetical protein